MKKKGSFIGLLILGILVINGNGLELDEDQETRLKREITVLNLVNGLDLTQSQKEMIIRSAEESQRLRQDYQSTLLQNQEKRETVLEENKMHRHIQLIMTRVRSLEDAEFEIQKEDLAKELLEHLKRTEPENQLIRKIEGFLLSAEIIPILEERIFK